MGLRAKKIVPRSAEEIAQIKKISALESAEFAYQARGLDEVHDCIMERFREIHYIHVMPRSENSCGFIIFYDTEERKKKATGKSGLEQKIIAAVYEELKNVGRGGPDQIEVYFEFDSDENVKKNYGSYFNRLR